MEQREYSRQGATPMHTSTMIFVSIVLAVATLALVLCFFTITVAGEEPVASGDREHVAQLLIDLRNEDRYDCQQIVNVLLGTGDGEQVDDKGMAMLLGLPDGESVDCETLLRLMLRLEDGEDIANDLIMRRLLGISDEDGISDEEITRLLDDPPLP